jgi:hypothetical protein
MHNVPQAQRQNRVNEDETMIPKGKFEWNLNTLVIIGGIVVGLVTTGVAWGVAASRLESSDAKTADWIIRHEALHRERQSQIQTADARLDVRITQLEGEARKIENLGYRITVAEQSNINTGKSIEQLTKTVNEQSTDIRVMREIIERQFGTPRKRM